MYSTCMFCKRPLGSNQVVETFPVGRRLAFDAERGRLWVICRRCERWNLTPMEERWEAVEDCERIFRGTRVRASTENIGLCRHPEGLELVRIGEPMRPEFAAWRYGDQFGRRRRKTILYGAAGVAVLGVVMVGGLVTGVISGALLGQTGNFVNVWVNGRTLVRLRTRDGEVLKLKNPDLQKLRILPGETPEQWELHLKKGRTERSFEGEEAVQAASIIMPRVNRAGARASVVQDAVRRIEERGHPHDFLKSAVREAASFSDRKGNSGLVVKLPHATKLAVEMALHEEQEMRAVQGELKALEAAWREAEEIAAISDDLLTPVGWEEFVAKHRDSSTS
jgi:hypothetical protein